MDPKANPAVISTTMVMAVSMVSLAAQLSGKSARLVIMDGSSPDSPQAGMLGRLGSALPNDCRVVNWREVPGVIAELNQEANRRVQDDQCNRPAIILLVYGLQRYRMLRRSEDAFGLSPDEEAQQNTAIQFAGLLREGPGVGIHVLTWADTLTTVERTVDRQNVREFDYRVLFQMSEGDSSNLIDAPVANRLGHHRALRAGVERSAPAEVRSRTGRGRQSSPAGSPKCASSASRSAGASAIES